MSFRTTLRSHGRRWLVGVLLAVQSLTVLAADNPTTETPAASSDSAPGSSAEQTAVEASAPDGAQTAASPVTGAAAAVQRREPLRLDPARPSLPTLANKPGWNELSAAQKQVLAPFASQWRDLPVNEQRAWADLARRFPQMDAQEQARVQRRIEEWAGLSPEQRKVARANYRMIQQTGTDNLQADWARYQAMTPEQRAVLGSVGSTSNTAARHAGAPTGLAKEAAQPLPRRVKTVPALDAVPASGVAPAAAPGNTAR